MTYHYELTKDRRCVISIPDGSWNADFHNAIADDNELSGEVVDYHSVLRNGMRSPNSHCLSYLVIPVYPCGLSTHTKCCMLSVLRHIPEHGGQRIKAVTSSTEDFN